MCEHYYYRLMKLLIWNTQRPVKRVPGLYSGGKKAKAWRWPRTPSSAEVKERVVSYL
jgi:hypothetical protein